MFTLSVRFADLDHMDEGSEPINARFNANVEFCHNPTAMTTENDYVVFLGELTQAGYHKLGKFTQEVDTLVEHLRNAIKSAGEVHYCFCC